MNDVTAREMKGIQQRQNDSENSQQGMRSELEVAVGNLGALITHLDKISLEEFVKHIPVSQVVAPTLDLLHQQVVEALSTYDSKVHLTLEEFSKAPNGIHSSVEEYLNQLRSSLIVELSQVFVDRVSDSISSFPNVSAILSCLSKVETEVDTWKAWNPDEEIPRDEVPKVSHPSSSHIMIPLYGQRIIILIRRVVVITPPHGTYRHNFRIRNFCVFILFLRRW